MRSDENQGGGRTREELFGALCAVVVIGLLSSYVIHLWNNYSKIGNDLRQKSAQSIYPTVDQESVSETGYIYEMRREKNIGEGTLNLVWFVVVPLRNTRWSCSYQAGFSDFKVGDSVRIIHKKSNIDTVDFSGYLIGLHEKNRARATDVWAIGLEDLELSLNN